MNEEHGPEEFPVGDGLKKINLHLEPDLYRAYQRCTWILINETGKNQIDIMNEMVRDFLVKHG